MTNKVTFSMGDSTVSNSDNPPRPPPHHREPGLELRLSRVPNKIATQHKQLSAFFDKIEAALADGTLRIARSAYTRFCDALESHFSLEEQIFFPALRGLRPDLGGRLAGLVHEHDGIREAVESLYEFLALSDPRQAQQQLAEVAALISHHEEREEALLDWAVHRLGQLDDGVDN